MQFSHEAREADCLQRLGVTLSFDNAKISIIYIIIITAAGSSFHRVSADMKTCASNPGQVARSLRVSPRFPAQGVDIGPLGLLPSRSRA
jgi:hypothetical protein